MSNVSNNMTTKLNGVNELADSLSEKLVDGDTLSHNRLMNTAGAIIGGAVGVAVTALSPKANRCTLGIATGWAIGGALGVYIDKDTHNAEEKTVLDAVVIGSMKTLSTTLIGGVANYLLGNTVEDENIEEDEVNLDEKEVAEVNA